MQVAAQEGSGGGSGQAVVGRWLALGVLLGSGFLNLIDITIVNVALPSLQAAFDATSSQIEWVVAAYILVFAVFLLPAGRLGDLYGRREMVVAGTAVFTLGSALCGMAPSMEWLLAARVVQAVGGAMMTPQTLAFVPALFAPKERGAAFALVGLTAGLAAVIGPLAGGLLIGADLFGLGWRPIFLVNLPVGLIALAATLLYVPRVKGQPQGGNDFVGIALAALTLLLIVFPLIEGRQVGWPLWCFGSMLASVPAGWAFVAWQRRQAARGGPQLLPVSLMANRNFVIGTGMAALLGSGIPSFFLVLAVFLQSGFGLSPLQSGLQTVPFSVGVLTASLVSGRMGSRAQRGRITVGALMIAGGIFGVRLVAQMTGDAVSWPMFAPPLFLAGIGLGTTISPLFQTVLGNVAGRDAGSASGALQAFQQVGGAVGVAIVGQMFFASLGDLTGLTGAAAHADFIAALRFAVIWVIGAFVVIAAGVWLLPAPVALTGTGHARR